MVDAWKFWDKIADKYAIDPIPDEAVYDTKLEATRELFRPDMDVLEIGCGTGGTALKHAPVVRHIRAIDFSEAMLAKARTQASAAGITNVSFERADIVEMPAEPEHFDVVLALSVLHLLDDPDAAIRKIHAMLKPGGYFVSSTACIRSMLPGLRFIVPLGRAFGLLPVLNAMTVDQLVGKIEAGGFEIEHRWHPSRGKALFVIAKRAA